MGKLARYAANSGGARQAPDSTAAPHEQRVFRSVRIREGHLTFACSFIWRKPGICETPGSGGPLNAFRDCLRLDASNDSRLFRDP